MDLLHVKFRDMNSRFENQFKTIEDSRKALFNSLRGYSDEALNKKPGPQVWSVVQVIQHLMASEEASLKYLQKKTQDLSKARPAGLKGAWRLFLTKAMFNVPVKFKSPAMLEPAETFVALKDLETRWTQTRADLYKLLSALPEKDLEKNIWKHVISGKMNIYQMLEFFNFHFNRHRKQIERTV